MTFRMLPVQYNLCIDSVNPKMATALVNKVTQDPRLQRLPAPLSNAEETNRVSTPRFPWGEHNSDDHTDDTISQEQSGRSSKPKPSGRSEYAYKARGSGGSGGLTPSKYNPYQPRQSE